MSELELQRIAERHSSATEGPYLAVQATDSLDVGIFNGSKKIATVSNPNDSNFLSHAWQDIKSLLEEVKLLRSVNSILREDNEYYEKIIVKGLS